jgi:hypothetical protein
MKGLPWDGPINAAARLLEAGIVRVYPKMGSAFFIADRYALTATHLIPDWETSEGGELKGEFRENETPHSLIFEWDRKYVCEYSDIALLELKGNKPRNLKPLQPAVLDPKMPFSRRAEFWRKRIFLLGGFPQGNCRRGLVPGFQVLLGNIQRDNPYTPWEVNQKHGYYSQNTRHFLNIKVEETKLQGISGGPLFDVDALRVIGVCSFTFEMNKDGTGRQEAGELAQFAINKGLV